jgi:hypothetical protein
MFTNTAERPGMKTMSEQDKIDVSVKTKLNLRQVEEIGREMETIFLSASQSQ